MESLQARVAQSFGAFGTRPSEEVSDRQLLPDNFLKSTLRLMAAIFLTSFAVWGVCSSTLTGEGDWIGSWRLDTALALVWLPLLVTAIWRYRLWRSARIYVLLCLCIEPFSESMFRQRGGGYWDTAMWPAAVAWYGTLKEFGGVPGASLSIFSVVTATLFFRALFGKRSATWTPPPSAAVRAMWVFFAAIVGLVALGIARGGHIDWAFRQTVQLAHLPLVALVFLYALRVPEDLAAIGTVIVCAGVLRSLLVLYVYFGVCMPAGITAIPGKPEWCTNHSDTVLFLTALMILMAHAAEQRSSKSITRAAGLGAVLLAGIVFNNRRLAFVGLATAPFVLYLAIRPGKLKNRLTVLLAAAVPLLVAYAMIGSESASASPLFKPAKLLLSVLRQKDASSISRDIENENLIYTLRLDPYLTLGFGHEYQYPPGNPPVDLSDVFRNFRIIAHNGVLWIWSVAGVAGFTLLWMVYTLAGTFALRGYRAARVPVERSAALACLGAVVVCVIQIWGDQGFNSYVTLVMFGIAYAVAARLAALRSEAIS